MKKMKRLVALFVCLATIASLFAFSIPASAMSASAITSNADELLVEKLEAMGVIENKYGISNNVTRKQMAEVIVKFLRLSVGGNSSESPFNDLPMTDAAYPNVKALYDMGVVTGDDQGNYNPNNNVTYDEALVFIINAIGHQTFAQRQGGYPTGYHRVALNHGMLKNLSMQNGSDPVKVIDLYKMLNAALTAAVVDISYNGDGTINYTLSKTETFLSSVYNIRKYRGQVTANEYTKLDSPDAALTDEQIEIDGRKYETPGYYYTYFLGYTVDYYIRHTSSGDEELVYVEETPKANNVVRIDAEDVILSLSVADRLYYKDEELKEQHITFVSRPDVIYNEQSWSGWTNLASIVPATGYLEALDYNNDDVYDIVFVYEYENVVVGTVDTYGRSIVDKYDPLNVIDLDSRKHEVVIKVAGETLNKGFDSIAPNQVLSIVRSKGVEKVISVYICEKTVKGTITEYDTEYGYLIGEEYYNAAYAVFGTPLSIGLSGIFYLDMNDKIVTYTYDRESDEGVYGVMTGIDHEGGVLASEIIVRIYTREGKFLELPLAKRVKINGTTYDLAKQFNTVLGAISRGGLGNLNNAYVIKYTATETEVTSIDTGAVGGQGNLNVEIKDSSKMTVRPGYMLAIKNPDNGDAMEYFSYDSTAGVVFCVPNVSDLGNLDKYQILSVPKTEHIYTTGATSYSTVESISLYSSGTSALPKINVMMIRGMVSSPVDSEISQLSVITDITTAVDKDGNATKKLYFDNKQTALVLPTIKFRSGHTTTSPTDRTIESLISGPDPDLRPGVVVQFGMDSDGFINNISTVAKCESDGTLTPLFECDSDGTNYYSSSNRSMGEDGMRGLVAAEVAEIDPETMLVKINFVQTSGILGVRSKVLNLSSASKIIMFDSIEEKAINITRNDIKVGDKLAIRVDSYFDAKDIIIFR